MSLSADLMTHIGTGAEIIWTSVKPYKEAILGLLTILGGGLATFFGAYKRQLRRPEEALSRAASTSPFAPRPFMLTKKDRELVREAIDTMQDMTRAIRRLGGVLLDDQDRNRRGDGGRHADR